MRGVHLCVGAMAIAACSSAKVGAGDSGQHPTLTLPARFAEGTGDPEDRADGGARVRRSAAPDGGTASPGPAPPSDALPDPAPLESAVQWEYVVAYRRGDVSVTRVRRLRFEEPMATRRQIGRFAIELWIGRELIDRVRFDFPLLGAEPPPSGRRKPLHQPPTLAAGAEVEKTVLVPDSPRATRALLVDRATGQKRALPWPPDRPLDAKD